jgi:hypothetical protein
MSQGLDVLNERRPASNTSFEWPPRGERRLGQTSVQPADQGGLLSRHVPIGHVEEADRDGIDACFGSGAESGRHGRMLRREAPGGSPPALRPRRRPRPPALPRRMESTLPACEAR